MVERPRSETGRSNITPLRPQRAPPAVEDADATAASRRIRSRCSGTRSPG